MPREALHERPVDEDVVDAPGGLAPCGNGREHPVVQAVGKEPLPQGRRIVQAGRVERARNVVGEHPVGHGVPLPAVLGEHDRLEGAVAAGHELLGLDGRPAPGPDLEEDARHGLAVAAPKVRDAPPVFPLAVVEDQFVVGQPGIGHLGLQGIVEAVLRAPPGEALFVDVGGVGEVEGILVHENPFLWNAYVL